MTVKELIEKLKDCNPDDYVYRGDSEYDECAVTEIETTNGTVYIY